MASWRQHHEGWITWNPHHLLQTFCRALYSETNVMLAGHPDTYNKWIDDTPINYSSPSFFPWNKKEGVLASELDIEILLISNRETLIDSRTKHVWASELLVAAEFRFMFCFLVKKLFKTAEKKLSSKGVDESTSRHHSSPLTFTITCSLLVQARWLQRLLHLLQGSVMHHLRGISRK